MSEQLGKNSQERNDMIRLRFRKIALKAMLNIDQRVDKTGGGK